MKNNGAPVIVLDKLHNEMELAFIVVCKRILSDQVTQREYMFFNKFAMCYLGYGCMCEGCEGCHNMKRCIKSYLKSMVKRVK